MNREDLKAFKRDLHRIHGNAVFFLEEYWNKVHPGRKLELTDEEKQRLFSQERLTVPYLEDPQDLHSYMQKYEEAKKRGLKDWEIF